ncbi:MAG: hypothetical protein JSS57_27155 [Proteobacteria bacterium]|nr:hypothetical protein [Pseudomonadota bacterium]
MKAKVRPMRSEGRLLPKTEMSKTPAFAGELSIGEVRIPELSRTLVLARLQSTTTGTQAAVLPELIDARLLWLDGAQLRLTGVERVGDRDYAQTWSVELG